MNARAKDNLSKYRMVIDWDEATYVYRVTFPELPTCTATGESREEALQNAQKAVEEHIRDLQRGKEPVPRALAHRKFSGKIPLRVRPDLHREISIKAYKHGMSVNKYIEKRLKEEDVYDS